MQLVRFCRIALSFAGVGMLSDVDQLTCVESSIGRLFRSVGAMLGCVPRPMGYVSSKVTLLTSLTSMA